MNDAFQAVQKYFHLLLLQNGRTPESASAILKKGCGHGKHPY